LSNFGGAFGALPTSTYSTAYWQQVQRTSTRTRAQRTESVQRTSETQGSFALWWRCSMRSLACLYKGNNLPDGSDFRASSSMTDVHSHVHYVHGETSKCRRTGTEMHTHDATYYHLNGAHFQKASLLRTTETRCALCPVAASSQVWAKQKVWICQTIC
jgi:hypothetical protein